MRLRTWLAVGVLGVAAVVAVLALLEDGSEGGAAGSTAFCEFEEFGGDVAVELLSSGLSCGAARRLLVRYRAAVRAGETAGMEEPTPVAAGWRCAEYPFSQYPLLIRCGNGARRFDLVGLAPSAHQRP